MSYGVAAKKVAVVDDHPFGRQSFKLELEEENFLTEVLDGHYGTIDNLVEEIFSKQSEAAVCDYKLNQNSYVMGTGAQAIEKLYNRNLPSILITNIDDEIIDAIRPHRQFIPVLLDKDEYEPHDLREGIEICELELKGEYQPYRKPWRAKLRINSVDDSGFVKLVVPGWDSEFEIQITRKIFPEKLQPFVIPDERFFAQINIGAESSDELYFKDFEDRN